MLKELPVAAAASVTSVRLADDRGSLKLVRLVSPAEGPRRFLVRNMSGDGAAEETLERVAVRLGAAWDAMAPAGDGGLRFAMANSESAAVWLSLVNSTTGQRTMVSDGETGGYYGEPRFARREAGTLITSVAWVDNAAQLVLFTANAEGAFRGQRPIPASGDGGLQSGLLVRSGDRYLLFAKFYTSNDERPAGHLYCSELDLGFKTVQPAIRCLGDRLIYGFDADAAGGQIAVVAETADGLLLARGAAHDALSVKVEKVAGGTGAPLTSISVLIHGGAVHVAAIEDAGTATAKVLVGAIPLK